MSHMPTQTPSHWTDVTAGPYSATGAGVVDDYAALQAAINAGSGRGVVIPAGTYRFDTMLNIPANTHVELWPGAVLQCRVTGGGHGIQLAASAKLYSVGGGGNSAQIVAYSGCNVDSLITNTSHDGTQEYIYISGLYIIANTGATIGTSLVDLVGVFVNSGVRDCVIIGNNAAPTGLRVAGTTATTFGPVFIEDTWVNTCTQHNIVITEGNPSAGGSSCWLTNVTSENQASGYYALYIKGYGGLFNVNVRNFHYENNRTATSTTGAILLDGCSGFLLDGADLLSSPITNKVGITITNSASNYRTLIRNVSNANLLNPILADSLYSQTFADRSIGFYQTSNPAVGLGSVDQVFVHNVQCIGGVTTKTKAGAVGDGDFPTAPPNGTIAVDTTNSKIYVRVGGSWKSVTVA